MSRTFRPALAFVVTIGATACGLSGSAGEPVDYRPTLVPLTPQAARLVSPAMVLLDKPPERPLYVLNVSLDYANGVLNTQQRIEFRNPAQAPLSEIKFNVPPARRAGAIDVTDARVFGSSESLTFTITGTVLTVKLPAPLGPRDAIAMQFNYALKVPLQEQVIGIGGDDTSRGPGSLTAGHWYVLLAPWKDGNWYTPGFVPVGDTYSSDIADFEVNVLAPEGVIVAGAGDEVQQGRLWRYSLQQARTFAFAASDRFKVTRSNVGGVEFAHYAYSQHEQFAEDVLITAERAVQLYSKLWGPYPYKTLRIVETGRAQGQEYSGLVGIGTRLYDGYRGSGARHDLIATTTHEVAHQWWFHVVGNDQIRTPWLDEAFARLAERYYFQTYYPNDLNWWYGYYIAGARTAKGAIDLPITAYADMKDYLQAVYQRGFLFLDDLRDLVGPEDFDAALRDYYQDQSYKITRPEAFFDALARHSKQDITKLVKGYFANEVPLPCGISANAIGCRR